MKTHLYAVEFEVMQNSLAGNTKLAAASACILIVQIEHIILSDLYWRKVAYCSAINYWMVITVTAVETMACTKTLFIHKEIQIVALEDSESLECVRLVSSRGFVHIGGSLAVHRSCHYQRASYQTKSFEMFDSMENQR